MPDSNPLYDLMGGYYPGEPLPRIRPNFNKPEPFEMRSDAFVDNYINSVKKELDKLSVSEQAKKLFIKDLERTFVVQVQPKKASYDPMRALELGDEEDVAGVQVKVDINPVKWVKDPKEMLKETGKQWAKDMFNWQDFDSYAERATLWNPLLKQGALDPETGEVIEPNPVIKYAYGDHIKEGVETELPPFRLFESGSQKVHKDKLIYEDAEFSPKPIEEDVFKDVVKSHKDFIAKVRSSGSRNGAFDSHVVSAANATSFELKQLLDGGVIKDPEQVRAVKDHLYRSKIIRYANTIIDKEDPSLYRFGDEINLSKSAVAELKANGEILYGEGIGKGMKKVTTELELFAQGKGSSKEVLGAWNSIFNGVYNDDGSLKEISTVAKAHNLLKEADDYYKTLGEETYSEFLRDTKPFRKLLDDMESFKENNANIFEKIKNEKNWGDKATAANLKGKLDYIKERYSREGPIKGGLQRMNRKYAENHLLKGPVAEVIFYNKKVVGSKATLNILEDNLRSYKREDFYDLLTKLEEDGVIGIAADQNWNLIRKRLNGMTPAALAEEGLKRIHYGGLKIDPDYLPGGEHEHRASKLVNRFIEKNPVFLNKQSIDINGTKFNFTGNRGLELAYNLYDRVSEDASPQLKLAGHEFFALLNGRTEILTGNVENKKIDYLINFSWDYFGKEGEERKIIQRAGDLRKWLKDHNDQLGLEIIEKNGRIEILNTKENFEILQKLFKGLQKEKNNPRLLDFARKYATPLEKFSQFSNKFQYEIFSRFKFLGTITQTRNIISRVSRKLISETLAKVASKLFGAAITATTGIGAIIVPLIEKAVQLIFKKVQDFLKNVLKSIKEGGLSEFIEEGMENSFQAMAKTTGIIVAVISIVFVLPSTMFFSTLMASIAPLDPTNMSSGLGAGPGAIFDGDCDYNLKETTGLTSSDPIVQEAIKLADPLEIGFWCIWNKHPGYPQFWNESRFRSNPNPSSTFSCADCLFWCTRLVIYSYRGAGYDFENELRSREQKKIFKDEHQYFVNKGKKTSELLKLGIVKKDENEIEAKDLEPGDVVFFYNPDRYDDINHVAIVSDIGGDTVETIHSNAGWKVLDLTISSSGGVQDFGNLQVIGFGRW